MCLLKVCFGVSFLGQKMHWMIFSKHADPKSRILLCFFPMPSFWIGRFGLFMDLFDIQLQNCFLSELFRQRLHWNLLWSWTALICLSTNILQVFSLLPYLDLMCLLKVCFGVNLWGQKLHWNISNLSINFILSNMNNKWIIGPRTKLKSLQKPSKADPKSPLKGPFRVSHNVVILNWRVWFLVVRNFPWYSLK